MIETENPTRIQCLRLGSVGLRPKRFRVRRAFAIALIVFAAAAFLVPAHYPALADGESIATLRKTLWPKARARGISKKTFNSAFSGVKPDPDVVRAANHQPEFVTPIGDYIAARVSKARILYGRKMLGRYRKQFGAIEKRYGVDRHILAAIWGLESNYGRFKGKKSVIRSLATLALERDRAAFGRIQLLAALQILQNGDIPLAEMKGSWAGAMGHTQFIPTTYHLYAVDFTGDGTRDIWRSISDALASTANMLRSKGWQTDKGWGYEVILPKDFDFNLSGPSVVKPLKDWAKIGVRRVGHRAFPRADDRASLIVPAGAKGPAFLVIKNFSVIKTYNNSNAYALAVGHLADRLMGFGSFVQAWPKDAVPLSRDEREELQRLLAAKGLLQGKIDGILGAQSRTAVRAYQRAKGLPPDGYPTKKLLEMIRHDGQG